MQQRFQLAQARRNLQNASLPSLDDVKERLGRLDTNSALLSGLDRLRAKDSMDDNSAIACPALEPLDGTETEEGLNAARETFAR